MSGEQLKAIVFYSENRISLEESNRLRAAERVQRIAVSSYGFWSIFIGDRKLFSKVCLCRLAFRWRWLSQPLGYSSKSESSCFFSKEKWIFRRRSGEQTLSRCHFLADYQSNARRQYITLWSGLNCCRFPAQFSGGISSTINLENT